MKNLNLKNLIIFVAVFWFTSCNDNVTTVQPNILFFITDDESWLERSAYGWSRLPAPHFDRVAEEGILFTSGFTSAPSCAPYRATILTGRNFWELKQGAFIQSYLPTELLTKNGYHVGYTGKRFGPNSYPKEGYDPFDENNHLLLEHEFGVTLDQITLPPHRKDNTENRQEKANQLYEICHADTHLGRMLASLETIGEFDNTLVVVTSDNGTAVEINNVQYGKASPYDYGVHEPLAIMWPSRISAGRTVTDFVSFADFAPTFLEVAGIKSPSGMSGRSILPLLESKKSGRIDPKRNFIVTGLEWHGEFDPVRWIFSARRASMYRNVKGWVMLKLENFLSIISRI